MAGTGTTTGRDAATVGAELREALKQGEHLRARELAMSGAAEFPDDPYLAKAGRILAPPKVIGHYPPNPKAGLDVKWLKQHAHEYAGQWVALNEGEFIGAADELDDLLANYDVPKGCFVAR